MPAETCRYAEDYKGVYPPRCGHNEPCRECKRIYLRNNGWSTWYHENYWVNRSVVEDPTRQDYTDYGMSLGDAFEYETGDYPKFKPMGMPAISKMMFPYRGD